MGKNKDNKDGFLLYKTMYGAISWLSNEKLGELTRAIFEWQISNGESCNAESPEVKAALQFFINQFNIDNSKYQQTCESNRNNINKRWDKDDRIESIPDGTNDTNDYDRIESIPDGTNDTNDYDRIESIPDGTNDTDKDKDKDKDINIISPDGECGKVPTPPPRQQDKIPYQKIIDMWNETCTSFHRLTGLSDKRKIKLRNRYDELSKIGEPLPLFRTLFEKMENSPFMKGDNNRGWKATFDWLISNGENWRKVLEGNYDTHYGPKQNPPREPTRPQKVIRSINDL